MKYPSYLFDSNGEIASFGDFRSYLCAVRYDTALRWAKRRTREQLEAAVAALVASRHPRAPNRLAREKRAHASVLRLAKYEMFKAEEARSEARTSARKVEASRSARVKGARVKHANSEAAAARKIAMDLWPTAKKKGWTAAKFHAELLSRGAVIAFDSARKWLTKLRKEGVC